jgi:hypothetical protein
LRQLQLLSISHGSINIDQVPAEEDIPTRHDLPSSKRAEPSAPELGARYTTGAEIARGGMGRVVEASDTLLGRAVALKEALCEDDEGLRRFARETRITARLEHPSIVPVYDAGRTAEGRPYYVMRKVAGRPLEKLVAEHPTARERIALLPHVLAAVEAVAHAHERGVIHRDLKPTNILVGTHGETMVIDWGLARELDDPEEDPSDDIPAAIDPGASLKTRVGAVFGTPGFMAPEQVRGVAVKPACDVYALGATLYHMLAATPPHAAPTGDEMMELAAKGPPKPLLELEPSVPRELAAIVARAMAYDERKRYRDAGELATELRRFLTGQLVAAHPYSRRERLVRFVRRHRAALAVTAIAIVALGVLGGLSVSRIVDERNEATVARRLAETARQREAARADDLLVAQAAALVTENPIAAVGLLHRLPPASESWRLARDVLADARLRGVPFGLLASPDTSGLAITRDGTVAYSAGTDGVIRRHELATGNSEQLHQITGQTGVVLALTGDERTLALAGERAEVVWIDLATRKAEVVPVASSPQFLAALAAGVVWTDSANVPWQLARGARDPVRLPGTFTDVLSLEMAPDHAHVVIDGRPDWVVVELGAAPRIVARFPDKRATHTWSADGKRLAIGHINGLDVLEISEPTKPRTIAKDLQVFAATFVGDDVYFASNGQLVHFYDAETGVSQVAPVPHAMYSQAFTTRDAAVLVSVSGLVVVIGRGGATTIRTPLPYVFRSVGHPQTGRFVVSARDCLLAYDAAAMTPRVIDTPVTNTIFHGFAGPRHFLMGYMMEDWQLFDVTTGGSHTPGKIPLGIFMAAPADASYLLVRPNKTTAVALARPGKELAKLHDDALGIARTPTRALIVTRHEAIEVDVATLAQAPLWRSPDEILAQSNNGDRVALATKTGVWRTDGKRHETITLPFAFNAFDIASDGTVFVASETAVSKWNPDGGLAEHCRLAKPARWVRVLPRVGVITIDRESEAWTCDPSGPAKRALPDGFSYKGLARRAPFAATLTHDQRLAVYDLETKHQWSLGNGEMSVADLAPDGRYVATYSHDRLVIYPLGLPEDRASYQRLLEATTNLRIGDTPNQIIWPAR